MEKENKNLVVPGIDVIIDYGHAIPTGGLASNTIKNGVGYNLRFNYKNADQVKSFNHFIYWDTEFRKYNSAEKGVRYSDDDPVYTFYLKKREGNEIDDKILHEKATQDIEEGYYSSGSLAPNFIPIGAKVDCMQIDSRLFDMILKKFVENYGMNVTVDNITIKGKYDEIAQKVIGAKTTEMKMVYEQARNQNLDAGREM